MANILQYVFSQKFFVLVHIAQIAPLSFQTSIPLRPASEVSFKWYFWHIIKKMDFDSGKANAMNHTEDVVYSLYETTCALIHAMIRR